MKDERKMWRGEVYYVRYDNSVGSEEAVGRPVILVSSQKGLDTAPIVQCLYLTTVLRQVSCNVHINSLHRKSYALCNQLNTIDKSRLDRRVGKVSDREMREIDHMLKFVLGLTDDEPLAEAEEVSLGNDSEEIAELKVELELHKKLYEKTLEKLVELRLEKDGVTEKPVVAPVEEPVKEPVEESLDLSGLVGKFNIRDTKKAKKEMSDGEARKILSANSVTRGNHIGTGKAHVKEGAEPININTASREEFESVGIHGQTARNIVNYRKRHGYFISVEDLLMVPRFGKGCLATFGSLLEV